MVVGGAPVTLKQAPIHHNTSMPETTETAKRKIRGLHRVAVAVILSGLLFGFTPPGQFVEHRVGLTALFLMRGEQPAPDKVLILAISRKTAEGLSLPRQQTAWSRALYGQLVDNLHAAGAAAIAFDIYFEGPGDAEGDERFHAAMQRAGNVLLFAWQDRNVVPQRAGALSEPALTERLVEPWPYFAQAARLTAPHVLTIATQRVERFPLRAGLVNPRPTLPLAALAMVQPQNLTNAPVWQGQDSLLFNFYGPAGTLRTLPLEDYLQSPAQFSDAVQGAMVWIGYASDHVSGQQDAFQTVYSEAGEADLSGVELAATAYANLRDRTYLKPVDGPIVLGAGLAIAWVAWWALVRRRLASGLIILSGLGLSYAALSVGLFCLYQHWLPGVSLLAIVLPLLAILGIRLHYWREVLRTQALAERFSHYLPQTEVARLLAAPGAWPLSRRQQGLCLVSDATGFTSLAERLSAEHLSELMVAYYEAIIDPIRALQGLVSDVTGDGVIAVWSDLTPAQSGARVTQLISRLDNSLKGYATRYPDYPLPTRLGFHWGEWVIGHFGASDHFEYRAVGDLINTTSRIEGLNKQLGTSILVSEVCGLPKTDSWRYVGRYCLAGKTTPLALYTPMPVEQDAERELFHWVEADLQSHDLSTALKRLETAVIRDPDDGPARYWLSRLRDAQADDLENFLPMHLSLK